MKSIRWVLVCAVVLAGAIAGGDARAEGVDIDAVDHVGRVDDAGGLHWTVHVAGDAPIIDGDVPKRVYFERPLDEGWSVESPTKAIRDAQGRIVGLRRLNCCLEPSRRRRSSHTVFSARLVYDGEAVILPALTGGAPERFRLDNGTFEPMEEGPLVKHIGSLVVGDVPESDRDQLEDAFGEVPAAARPVIYAHTLPGHVGPGELVRVQSEDTLRARAVLFGGAGLLVLLLIVAGALRWLRDDARAEAAEAYLAELDDPLDAA